MDDRKKREIKKKKVVREVATVEVAVLGSSGVSRVYRRIVRYDFRIGTLLPFFHCELLSFFLGPYIIWGVLNQCVGPIGCILDALIYAFE